VEFVEEVLEGAAKPPQRLQDLKKYFRQSRDVKMVNNQFKSK
jgi:hypothetical protein